MLTDPRAIEYIKTNLKKYSEQQIVDAMVKSGYDEVAVRETIANLRGKEIPEQSTSITFPKKPFAKSWYLAKICFRALRDDGELIMYTILSSLLGLLFFGIMFLPYVIAYFAAEVTTGYGIEIIYVVLALVFYFGMIFISSFFKAATVTVVRTRVEGGNPTFGTGISSAFHHIHHIFLWSLLNATIGVLLQVTERASRRLGPVGIIVFFIVQAILGLVWTIITLFAIPAMIIDNVGPFQAIKNSVNALKKTWGESLILGIGLGAASVVLQLPGFLFIAASIVSLVLSGTITAWFFIYLGIGVIWLILGSLILTTMDSIWRTVVYLYAKNGTVAPNFDKRLLDEALKPRKKLFGK